MNKAPEPNLGLNNLSPGAAGNVNLSKNNLFYAFVAPASSSNSSTPALAGLGENIYLFRFVSTQDLQLPSPQAKVSIVYRMPDMPQMGEERADAARQADGSFSATLFFSMLGKWQIQIKIQDGMKQDEYNFETIL